MRRLSGDRLGHVVVRATKVHGEVIPSGEFGLFPEFHAEVAADGSFTLKGVPVVDVALQATDGSSHSAVLVLRAAEVGTRPVLLELDDRAPHLGPDDQPGTE